MALDAKRAERAISEFLEALGVDATDPELKDTPARVVEAFSQHLLQGYAKEPRDVIREAVSALTPRKPGSGAAEWVIVKDLSLVTTCPHHLMPAWGSVTVGYLPGPYLLGFGVISELVEVLSRRLTLQELIGERLVESLVEEAQVRAAYAELRLRHGCLSARGKGREQAEVVSTARAGADFPEHAASLSLALGGTKAPL